MYNGLLTNVTSNSATLSKSLKASQSGVFFRLLWKLHVISYLRVSPFFPHRAKNPYTHTPPPIKKSWCRLAGSRSGLLKHQAENSKPSWVLNFTSTQMRGRIQTVTHQLKIYQQSTVPLTLLFC